MDLKKIYYRLLYLITQNKKYKKRYKENWGINNKLIIKENGSTKELPPDYDVKLKWLDIHWRGNNNTVTIEMPAQNLIKLEIFIKGDNNNICIGKNLMGNQPFTCVMTTML